MRTVLVTGASRGIGLAVARRLAQAGHQLALHYRGDESAARDLAAEMSRGGVPHALLRADIADPAEAAALPGRVVERFGRLDALVNNAGITDDTVFMTMPRERYARVLQTNLFGTMRLTHAALPHLCKAEAPAIVMMSSLGGVVGKEGQVAYATSKGGLIGFTQWLAARYGHTGLRVNAVAPGFIETDMTRQLKPAMTRHILEGTALGRAGRAEEVAEAVFQLLQPGYVQATTLRVDGGFNR
jgi:3-oxoacyl-[acyl-carrier protein] reductase